MTGWKLTENQREVLANAEFSARERPELWWRPMDLGGFDASHHSATAGTLAKRGLLERRDRGSIAGLRAVWLYRITDAGRAALSAAQQQGEGS